MHALKLNEKEAFSALWQKGGCLVVWRREHAWVALGNKQTFIPAVSCLLDLRGATDSSWIHLALVKHVQRQRVFTHPGRSTVHPEQPRRQLSLPEMLITRRYFPACKPYQLAATQRNLNDETEEQQLKMFTVIRDLNWLCLYSVCCMSKLCFSSTVKMHEKAFYAMH